MDQGIIPLDQLDESDAEFTGLVHEYDEGIFTWGERVSDFNQAYGLLNITLEQPSLKRINWQIFWLSNDGIDEKFDRNFWLHADSLYWEQYGLKDLSFLSAEEGKTEE